MKPEQHRTFFYFYDANAETFQIVVRMKDVPGALNTVLERLRDRVNLISSFSYNLDDGTAMWSGFGKSLSSSETKEKLKLALKQSSNVEDVEVTASSKGLLLDSFHVGLTDMLGVSRIVLSTTALRRMFGDVVQMFGSGGATLLFEEGQSMGKTNGGFVKKLLGPSIVREKSRDLLTVYSSMGWGVPIIREWKPGDLFALKIEGCFECDGKKGNDSGCNFQRGHLAGLLSAFFDVVLECNETKCTTRGDRNCEFELRPSIPVTIR